MIYYLLPNISGKYKKVVVDYDEQSINGIYLGAHGFLELVKKWIGFNGKLNARDEQIIYIIKELSEYNILKYYVLIESIVTSEPDINYFIMEQFYEYCS